MWTLFKAQVANYNNSCFHIQLTSFLKFLTDFLFQQLVVSISVFIFYNSPSLYILSIVFFTQKPSSQNFCFFISNLDWLLPWHATEPPSWCLTSLLSWVASSVFCIAWFPVLDVIFISLECIFKHLPKKVGLRGPRFTLFFRINTSTSVAHEVRKPVSPSYHSASPVEIFPLSRSALWPFWELFFLACWKK